MEWRFTIIDRDNIQTVIDEPVGWADIKFKLSRDKDMHGLFYDYTANGFEFWGKGKDLIKADYKAYGLEGIMFLQIEYKCTKTWQPFTTGRILFANYNESTGPDCYVKVGIDNISEIVALKNRMEQSVDLLSNTAFDGVTTLGHYDKLPFSLSLPSKAVPYSSKAVNDAVYISPNLVDDDSWRGYPAVGGGRTYLATNIIPAFTKTISTAINNTQFNDFVALNTAFTPENSNGNAGIPMSGTTPMLAFQELAGIKCLSSTMNIKYRFRAKIDVSQRFGSASPGTFTHFYIIHQKASDNSYTTIADHPITNVSTIFDFQNTLSLVVNPGDNIWAYIHLYVVDLLVGGGSPKYSSYVLTEYPECSLEFTLLSTCDPTDADVFMVNEALSRTIENITNNQMSLYSEYFGRPDSQPYSVGQLGRGSLEAITSGLKIRRVKSADGSEKQFFVNLKQLFNDLSSIHCLGMGIQAMEDNFDLTDDLTNMYNPSYVVRIEDWKWFYKDYPVLSCEDVDAITREIDADKHIAKFNTGYEKWEAEQTSGLDELLTKRSYATQLTQVDNSLDKVCKMIASGYAIEVTRRQDITTTDWRYDNETFIICLNSDLTVQLGGIDNAQNIVDPDTVYNYRISPARNLMRWFAYIIASYRNATGQKLKFTEGDGNLVAKGEMNTTFDKMDNTTIQENQDIDASLFLNPEYATPILRNETVQFNYPMSAFEFKSLINNPYGLISWSCKQETGSGWISEITYEPNSGIASFTLIPKIEQ